MNILIKLANFMPKLINMIVELLPDFKITGFNFHSNKYNKTYEFKFTLKYKESFDNIGHIDIAPTEIDSNKLDEDKVLVDNLDVDKESEDKIDVSEVSEVAKNEPDISSLEMVPLTDRYYVPEVFDKPKSALEAKNIALSKLARGEQIGRDVNMTDLMQFLYVRGVDFNISDVGLVDRMKQGSFNRLIDLINTVKDNSKRVNRILLAMIYPSYFHNKHYLAEGGLFRLDARDILLEYKNATDFKYTGALYNNRFKEQHPVSHELILRRLHLNKLVK